jgi:hypothetical protein
MFIIQIIQQYAQATVLVYSSKQTKHVIVLCEGNALLLNADAGGIPLPYLGEVQK